MEVKYDIVICTTAVSRSELHKEIFPRYVTFLEGLRCKWYINIDQIEGEESLVTKAELTSMIDNNLIDLHININSAGGSRESFYKSAQYLVNLAKETIPKFGYLWLEDDWMCYSNVTLKSYLNEITFNSKDYLQLVSRNKELSFNPSLYGVELFDSVIVKGLLKEYTFDNANPERACTYPPTETIKLIDVYYTLPSFKDAGRDWTQGKGMWRTFQPN